MPAIHYRLQFHKGKRQPPAWVSTGRGTRDELTSPEAVCVAVQCGSLRQRKTVPRSQAVLPKTPTGAFVRASGVAEVNKGDDHVPEQHGAM